MGLIQKCSISFLADGQHCALRLLLLPQWIYVQPSCASPKFCNAHGMASVWSIPVQVQGEILMAWWVNHEEKEVPIKNVALSNLWGTIQALIITFSSVYSCYSTQSLPKHFIPNSQKERGKALTIFPTNRHTGLARYHREQWLINQISIPNSFSFPIIHHQRNHKPPPSNSTTGAFPLPIIFYSIHYFLSKKEQLTAHGLDYKDTLRVQYTYTHFHHREAYTFN